ncbi:MULTISPECIES: sulfite exporter TauE/SafE family protein [Spirosoma]|uniref:Probable membrane transporter protein n=1 Tax=Spirosoma pollinicola TaxID=2057025 RepID=A0A2K8Z6A3_9BACT|nr:MULTISPECIES: sulfite exporter TauE/SafE family protein [Spirosoma]AUD05417.1 anion permease [Spirosoma pollinicola]RYF78236.1 MAG: sulfite exporter TauE/SafE family protein [Cytophagaceae bacterium]
MTHVLLLLLLGLLAGALSGLIGIGGGIIIVPALVLLFGFSQTTAQGTALATLIPPVGLLAAFAYYKEGAIDIWAAVWIAAGFLIGGFFGAKLATMIPVKLMTKGFAVLLVGIAIKLWFTK